MSRVSRILYQAAITFSTVSFLQYCGNAVTLRQPGSVAMCEELCKNIRECSSAKLNQNFLRCVLQKVTGMSNMAIYHLSTQNCYPRTTQSKTRENRTSGYRCQQKGTAKRRKNPDCKTVGQICSVDDECSIQHTVCFAGVCLCKPGLYFSPRHNGCLKECAEYGDDMDIYKNAAIHGHNDKTRWVSSPTSCSKRCAEEKRFTCLTADYNTREHLCHMSRSGYLDVKKADRELDITGWDMAQRRCK